jgi:hypothetical protein
MQSLIQKGKIDEKDEKVAPKSAVKSDKKGNSETKKEAKEDKDVKNKHKT